MHEYYLYHTFLSTDIMLLFFMPHYMHICIYTCMHRTYTVQQFTYKIIILANIITHSCIHLLDIGGLKRLPLGTD